jgi:hypothetical protein
MDCTKSFAAGTTLIGAYLLAANVSLAELHATEEFESGATRPVSIALLPPHVELTKQGVIRRHAEVEESGELEGHLLSAVAAELQSHGYQLTILSADAINTDPRLQEMVVDGNRRFTEFLGRIRGRMSKQVRGRRHTAGDEMKLLAARLGVDALAFTRMQMVAPGAGAQALRFLGGGGSGTQTMMTVTLIDGTTSDIEAHITLPIMRRGKVFGGYNDVMADPVNEMAKLAAATLQDMPDVDPSSRVEESEEDVLSDIESLLD